MAVHYMDNGQNEKVFHIYATVNTEANLIDERKVTLLSNAQIIVMIIIKMECHTGRQEYIYWFSSTGKENGFSGNTDESNTTTRISCWINGTKLPFVL